jgi:hypothetical protein
MRLKLMLLTSLSIFLHKGVAKGQTTDTKFYDVIPIRIREKASVAFIGTFFTERGLSDPYEVGKSRWRLIKGFEINNDFIENLKVKRIELNPSLLTDSLRKKVMEHDLLDGEKYCILLRPQPEKLTYITDGSIAFNYYNHLIGLEEIILIIKLK